MCCDLDPWAAFNLKQHKNIPFFPIYVLSFLLLGGKILPVSALTQF